MNALRLFLALVLVLVLGACAAHPPEACRAACAKGLTLAKAALVDATKAMPLEAQDVALAEWKNQEAGLKATLTQCEERCTRDPHADLLSCIDAAKSLQAYTGCLR